jgi:hypothetical protein
MGFLPGEFVIQGKANRIVLYNATESEISFEVNAINVHKCAKQLMLLADMLAEERL